MVTGELRTARRRVAMVWVGLKCEMSPARMGEEAEVGRKECSGGRSLVAGAKPRHCSRAKMDKGRRATSMEKERLRFLSMLM